MFKAQERVETLVFRNLYYAPLRDLALLFLKSPSSAVYRFQAAIKASCHTCWSNVDKKEIGRYASANAIRDAL
jgi:hypothetical protein